MTNKELQYRKELKRVLGLKRMYRNGYRELESSLITEIVRQRLIIIEFGLGILKVFKINKKKHEK